MPIIVKHIFDKTEFDFSGALKFLKAGQRMKRLGWSSPGMWIELYTPESKYSPVTKPFFIMYTKTGDYAVWFPSICDLLADDWVIV
jgi:hypothetical protein